MSDHEQPVRKDSHGEWVGNAEDLSQINSVLRRIQATAASANANQPPKPGNGGTPPAGQTGNNK